MRLRRLLVRIALVVTVVPVTVVAATLIWFQTGPGKRHLASLIESQAAGPGLSVEIGGIAGTVPTDMTVTGIAIGDDAGVWLTVDRAALSWSPWALLSGEVAVAQLAVATVTVQRLPEAGPDTEDDTAAWPPAWPELPVSIAIDSLTAERIILAEPVAGLAATLAVAASARLGDPNEGLALELDVRRTDGVEANAALALDYVPTDETLSLTLSVEEPSGGLIAQAAGLPGRPPVVAGLRGSGRLDDWRAELDARAGDVAAVTGTGAIRSVDAGRRFTFSLSADLADAVEPAVAPLLGDEATLAFDGVLTVDDRLLIERADAETSAFTVSIVGGANLPAGDRGLSFDMTVDFAAPDSAPFAAMLPGIGWSSLVAAGSVSGTVEAPSVALDAVAETITAETWSLDAAQVSAMSEGPVDSPTATLAVRADALSGPGIAADRLAVDARTEGPLTAPQVTATVAADGIATDAATIDAATVSATIDDPLGASSATASISADGMNAGERRVERLSLDLTADLSASYGDPRMRAAVTAEGRLDGISIGDPAIDPLLADGMALSVSANGSPAGTLAIDRLVVELPTGGLAASGTVDDWGRVVTGDASLTIDDLAPLGRLAGLPLAGQVTLDAEAATEDGDVSIALSGAASGIETGLAQVDALLGDRAAIDANATRGADGAIAIGRFSVAGERIDIGASGTLDGARLDARWSLALSDLSAVLADLSGRLEASGTATGDVAAPRVDAAVSLADVVAFGRSVPVATVTLGLADITAAPQADIAVDGTVDGLPVEAAAAVALAADGTVDVADLTAQIGPLSTSGAVTIRPSGTADGTLAARAGDLSALAGIAGQPIRGAGTVDLVLSDTDGRQAIEARLTGQGIGFGDTASAATVDLTARLTDVLATPGADVQLAATGVEAAGLSFDRVDATAGGGLQALDVGVSLSGSPLSVTAQGQVVADADTTISVASLSGSFQEEPFALAGPASVTLGDGGVAVSDLRLTVRDGRIALDGRFGGGAVDLSATVAQLPLGLARLAAPDLSLDGMLDADISLRGSLAAPDGTIALTASGVRAADTLAASLPPLELTAQADWRGGRLSGQAGVTAGPGADLAAGFDLPLTLDAGGAPAPFGDRPINVSLTGAVSLEPLNDLLADGGHRLGGRLDIDLGVAGSAVTPRLNGTAMLVDGSYENVLTGVRVDDIEVELAGTQDRLTLSRFRGTTPNGGPVTASGSVAAEPGDVVVDVSLTLDDCDIIASDLLYVVADADLSLTGRLADRLRAAGSIDLTRAEITIPNQLPVSVPALDVVEINRAGTGADEEASSPPDAAEETAGGAAPVAMDLDLSIGVPGPVFVRGRGIFAEMGGGLSIRGTADRPDINGELTLLRGSLDLLGSPLTFERGTIGFTGGDDLDPALDFSAATDVADVTARVLITGRASAPSFAFTSSPELPEDEILSRLLFGKATGALTPFEAVRMANSLAELSGTGGGRNVVDGVRQAIGIDRLDIETGDGIESSTLSAGSYVADGVFVGVQQGVQPGSSRVTVEVEVTPNVSVEVDAGVDSTGRVGVIMEWDY